MSAAGGGYVTEIPYLRDFKPELAPARLDHVAIVCGVAPPAREPGFAWCDLGCGQGVTAAVLAATHPQGRFHAIDLMPEHIGNARRLAAEAGIGNLVFHAADFAAALSLDLPRFDYIVAHGVYTWVEPASQQALLALIDRHLAPGGLVYLSYNTLPGWAADLPVQHLLRALHNSLPGKSAARASAAADFIRALAAAQAPGVAASFVARELQQRPGDYGPAYLVHEFMHAGFRPVYVTEIRAVLAAIGLSPVGSATLAENFDALVLSDPARAVLAGLEDPDLRELVRDFFLGQRFRCDVFARGNRRLGEAERAALLAGSSFALARPAEAARYAIATLHGRVARADPQTRAVVAALRQGPRRLAEIGPGLTEAVLTLCATEDVIPVEPSRSSVAALNRGIARRLGGPQEIRWLALPCGTAVEAPPEILRAAGAGGELDAARFPGWRRFLSGHGL